MRKYIYLGPFAPSSLFSSSISCILCPIYSQYSGYYLPFFSLILTHSIVGRNLSCHCMSRPSHTFNPLPIPTPPIDHTAHINNYYLLRSFQKNWSLDSLVHLSVPRHAFNQLAAGEHYFEWRVAGNPFPIVSVCFIACPALEGPTPITYSHLASRFKGLSLYVIYHTIPDYLPCFIEDAIHELGDSLDIPTSPFITFLDEFINDFYCPISPIQPPKPLDPLES